jgi:enoyl-[acyl-carrier-protein] reductase (NADH)
MEISNLPSLRGLIVGIATSPGPIRTRAGSGIAHFDELLVATAAEAPEHHLARAASPAPSSPSMAASI